MGEEALVESQIADSIALINSLDEADKPSIAIWYYFSDASECAC